MMGKIAKLHIDDLKEGDSYFFEETITKQNVDDFASLSRDYSTLHIEEQFAKSRGFQGIVVHGGLLVSLLSRLVGMYLPGENGMLQSMNIHFLSPVYIGDLVRVGAEVNHISQATKTIVLEALIENCTTEAKLVRAKIQVGFTQ